MRVLVLTGRFGMGHYCVAGAVREKIKNEFPHASVVLVDIVEALMPSLKDMIYKNFSQIAGGYLRFYNFMGKHMGKICAAPMKNVFVPGIEAILKRQKPDVVFSTLPMSTQYVAAYKKRKKTSLPLYTCITDVSDGDEWMAPQCDGYFVACSEVKADLIEKGVPSEKIHVSGIPVRKNFIVSASKEEEKKSLLIMGGGLGLINLKDDFYDVLNRDPSVSVTVITGKNKELFDELTTKYQNLTVLEYTDCVSEYLKKADMVLTKAGGSGIFEAIGTVTPMFILCPFIHHEIANARFIEERGIGCVNWANNISAEMVLQYLNNDIFMEDMRFQLLKTKRELDPQSICNVLSDYFGDEEKAI